MSLFEEYKRTQISEMRHVEEVDILIFQECGEIRTSVNGNKDMAGPIVRISISEQDLKNNSPKLGDMIARNPKNHLDQWLVAKEYFDNNFEKI